MKAFGIVGWKNAGKTTLVARLVTEIAARGFAVSTLKHAHAGFDVDREGADSWRHREAGAHEVLVASPRRWALMHEARSGAETPLTDLLARLSPVDLVLIEGWKREGHPKLEVRRAAVPGPLLAASDPSVRAVASDGPVAGLSAPLLPLDDAAAVADFILRETGLA